MKRAVVVCLLWWLPVHAGFGQPGPILGITPENTIGPACFGIEVGGLSTDDYATPTGSNRLWLPGGTEQQIGEDNQPLFVFAAIGDAHISDDRMIPGFDNSEYLTAGSIVKELLTNYVNDIRNHVPRVDFTIVLGDISDKAKAWELNKAAEILNNLNSPYYPIVGNHDNFQDDDKAAWKSAFGYDSTHYVFHHKGFKFIVIDPTLNPYDPPDYTVLFDEKTRGWVRSELIKDPSEPTFLINHYPLLNQCWNAQFETFTKVGQNCLFAKVQSATEDQESTRTRWSSTPKVPRYYGVPDGGEDLRSILENYGNVIASINGHVHANRIEDFNGITYICVGATLVGRPSVRYFYVYSNRVEIDYEYISDRTLFDHVSNMCPNCGKCYDPNSVCSFIDGRLSDRRSVITF